jgi:hypothetical protein
MHLKGRRVRVQPPPVNLQTSASVKPIHLLGHLRALRAPCSPLTAGKFAGYNRTPLVKALLAKDIMRCVW